MQILIPFFSLFFFAHSLYGHIRSEVEFHTLWKSFQEKENIYLSVVDLDSKKVLFEYQAEKSFSPLQTTQLFVGAGALGILNPQFVFKTEVFSSTHIEDGVIEGDLIFKGSGDPSLTLEDLEKMIRELKLHQVRKILGDLVLDRSEFDEVARCPGWLWEDRQKRKTTAVEPFILNNNAIDVIIQSDHHKKEAIAQLLPALSEVKLNNYLVVEKISKHQNEVSVRCSAKGIELKGKISSQTPLSYFSCALPSGSSYFAAVVLHLLKKYEIEFEGRVRFDDVEKGKYKLSSHTSLPLYALVSKMIKHHHPLYANAMLKKMGRVKYGKPGTWPNGAQALRQFLKPFMENTLDDLLLLDGAGECCYNKITARAMTEFLVGLQDRFCLAPEFLSSLSLSGMDGTLRKRFKEHHLYGTIRGTAIEEEDRSVYCGYLTREDRSMIAFCLHLEHKERLKGVDKESFKECLFQILYKSGKEKL